MRRTLLYVAYPMRLDLGAANAIQTYNTVRELRAIIPDVRLVIPRWLRETSAFTDLDVLHLPRPAVNKLSKFMPWSGWSYIERTLYSAMLILLLVVWRVIGRGYRVLYVRDTVCAAWLGLFRLLHGSRIVYEIHDLEADHPSRSSRWPEAIWSRFLPWLDRVAIRQAEVLVSLTRTFKDWVVQRKMKTSSRVVVIPDAFNPELYYPVDMSIARREVALPQSDYVIGYAGLTFAYRGLETLVDAFSLLLSNYPNALLALVGGRPTEVDSLRSLVAKLHIPQDRILFTGQLPQERAVRYIQASDVLVIPDTVTGMTASPLKLFEYMAVGRSIICKDMPALREIISKQAALFFEGGNPKALASALAALADDPERRKRMGAAAHSESRGYTYAARAAHIREVVNGAL